MELFYTGLTIHLSVCSSGLTHEGLQTLYQPRAIDAIMQISMATGCFRNSLVMPLGRVTITSLRISRDRAVGGVFTLKLQSFPEINCSPTAINPIACCYRRRIS